MRMQMLTPKQKIVLQAIKQYLMEKGQSPTVRELRQETTKLGLSLKSLRSFFIYLNALEEKGYIQRTAGERGISLKGITKNNFVDVPVLGMANAGTALMFADEYVEGFLKVSKRIVRDLDVFAVQVSGTSMNLATVDGKNIEDGDFILVDKNAECGNGDKVLVIIDGLATVKTFRTVDGRNIALTPESSDPQHKPIFLTEEDNFVINGKVIDVLKMG